MFSRFHRTASCHDAFVKRQPRSHSEPSSAQLRRRENGSAGNSTPTIAVKPVGQSNGAYNGESEQMPRFERLTSSKRREWLAMGADHGFIRLYTPSGARSLVFPVTIANTVMDVCTMLGFEAIYMQTGNLHIRRLANDLSLLQLQNEVLATIGHDEIGTCMRIGDAGHLKQIFCFYMGQPEPPTLPGTSNEMMVANCYVRRGGLLQRWARRKCVLFKGQLRVDRGNDHEDIVELSRCRVDVTECNRGKAVRLSDASNQLLLSFDSADEANLWANRCQQVQMAPTCDLSDRQLLFLPEQLFTLSTDRLITSLNLRRNSLQSRPANTSMLYPIIGWLDDVSRLQSLRSLNLADNALYHVPLALTQLEALTELILSDNQISIVPIQFRLLVNLTHLNLSNNWLTTVPTQLSECTMLRTIDLSFNRFLQIPELLFLLPDLSAWQLSGNEIPAINRCDAISMVHVKKLELRRNSLGRTLRLNAPTLDSLTHLDLRDNSRLVEVDLSNLPSLQVLHCERTALITLQVNGSELRALYADYNALDHIVVMPIPVHLISFSISHNKFQSLPDWLTDLPQLETLNAAHNQLKALPYRILSNVPSLRMLSVDGNQLTQLPEMLDNCNIETLNCRNNRIEHLPVDLFKKANRLRSLNATGNRLIRLPSASATSKLHSLRLAGNHLNESIVPVIVACSRLRLLDLSDNQLRFFDDSMLDQLTLLEEVNLSRNQLTSLPSAFSRFPNLQTLRAHSNLLATVPNFTGSQMLKTLDFSNNQLDHLCVANCMTGALKHLDLTCNAFLHLERAEIRPPKRTRSVQLVDVGQQSHGRDWQFGFAETAGQRNKLCIKQILPDDQQNSIFAIIDGGSNDQIPIFMQNRLVQYVEKESCDHVGAHALKQGLLRCHEFMGEIGERMGASAIAIKISGRRLYLAHSGHARAVLCKDGEPEPVSPDHSLTQSEYWRIRAANAIVTQDGLIEGTSSSPYSLGYSFLYPAVIPNPSMVTVDLTDEHEFVVMANRALWQTLDDKTIINRIKAIRNPVIAAKILQDMVQAHDYVDNLSIIVIRLAHLEARPSRPPSLYGDLLLRNSHLKLSSSRPSTSTEREANRSGGSTPSGDEEEAAKRHHAALEQITQRLEAISQAISKIEDDSNNNRRSRRTHGDSPILRPRPSLRLGSLRRQKRLHNSMEMSRLIDHRQAIHSTASSSLSDASSSFGGDSAVSAPMERGLMRGLSGNGRRFFKGLRQTISADQMDLNNDRLGPGSSRERFHQARNALLQKLKMKPSTEQPAKKSEQVIGRSMVTKMDL